MHNCCRLICLAPILWTVMFYLMENMIGYVVFSFDVTGISNWFWNDWLVEFDLVQSERLGRTLVQLLKEFHIDYLHAWISLAEFNEKIVLEKSVGLFGKHNFFILKRTYTQRHNENINASTWKWLTRLCDAKLNTKS